MFAILLAVFLFNNADCVTTTVNTPFVYNSNAILNCNLVGTISFYANGVAITADGSKYILNSMDLTITKLKSADTIKNYTCASSNGDKVIFNRQIAPYLYQVDQLLITNIETFSVTFACYLLVGSENGQSNTFYWQLNSQTLSSTGRFSIVSDTTVTKLTINDLTTKDDGYYYCHVNNTYGNANRNTRLRVKSRLAPLYPFLGCVGQIIFLSVFLFCKWHFNKKDETKSIEANESESSIQPVEANVMDSQGNNTKRVNFKAETMNTFVMDAENESFESKELASKKEI